MALKTLKKDNGRELAPTRGTHMGQLAMRCRRYMHSVDVSTRVLPIAFPLARADAVDAFRTCIDISQNNNS